MTERSYSRNDDDLIAEIGRNAAGRGWSGSRQAATDDAMRELARRAGTATGDVVEDRSAGARELAKSTPYAVAILRELGHKQNGLTDAVIVADTLQSMKTPESRAALRDLASNGSDVHMREEARRALGD